MDVTMALAAEDVQFVGASSGGSKLHITGVFDQIVCVGMPCTYVEITVLVGFSANPTEFGTQRPIQVYLLDPDGTQLLGLQRMCTFPASPRAGSRSYFHLTFPFRDITFRGYGPQAFSVKVGENHTVDMPIYVSE